MVDPDQTICFCHFVSLGQLTDAIQKGCRTLEEIKKQTCASTGCGGCESEVVEILHEVLQAGLRKARWP
ncbi:(2Fe-2S)-binding protein [Bdellovibrionota bacterium FG-1]